MSLFRVLFTLCPLFHPYTCRRTTAQSLRSDRHTTINPNRSLDRYDAICYKEYNFLPSFIFLLASCCSFVLDVARYAFELTINHLLYNLMKYVPYLITDLG